MEVLTSQNETTFLFTFDECLADQYSANHIVNEFLLKYALNTEYSKTRPPPSQPTFPTKGLFPIVPWWQKPYYATVGAIRQWFRHLKLTQPMGLAKPKTDEVTFYTSIINGTIPAQKTAQLLKYVVRSFFVSSSSQRL